jgi:predicted dehydrogenase
VDLRLFGQEGMLLFDLEEGRERLEVVHRRDGQGDDTAATIIEMQAGEGAYECIEPVDRFTDICLGHPVENDAPGEVGAHAVEVLDAAYRSAQSGRLEAV